MFQLKKIRPQVYLLNFKSGYELAMTFLRYQEFYEAVDDRFRGKKFTIAQFMAAYSSGMSNRTRAFMYPKDWAGFNLPLDVIKQVRELGIDDPNHYDSLMHGIYELIQADTNGVSYLIGTYGRGKKILNHELAHAMYYIDKHYKSSCLAAIKNISVNLRASLFNVLRDFGYTSGVLHDEIQAYITTGEMNMFDDIAEQEELDVLRDRFKKLYEKHNSEFI